MRVSGNRLDLVDGQVGLPAQVEELPGRIPEYRVWFRFPRELEGSICVDGNPLFAAELPSAALSRVFLRIELEVDVGFLRASRQILAI